MSTTVERDGASTIGVLTSGVVRGRTASTIARTVAIGLLVAGCAQLADLGGPGAETAPATPDASGGTEPKSEANIEITPSALEFGEVGCGTEPAAQLITIRNKGGLPVTYKAQTPAGTSFRLDGELEGTLAPKGVVTLNVFVNPRAAGDNGADLVVKAGDAFQQIHASAKGTGPTFELEQSTIAFGDVRKENGAPPVDVAVKNTGSEAISVADFTSSDPAFEIQWSAKPGAFTVPPNGSASFKVALLGTTNVDPTALTATIKPNSTKFCGAPPVLTVSGRRVTSDVTINPADWGKQSCNTTPGSKDVVITSYANAIVNYTVALGPASAFTIQSEGPLAVAAAPTPDKPMTAVIRIAPKQLGGTAPLLDVKELLAVVLGSTAPGVSGRRDLPLHVETRGAIVTITPAALSFTSNGTKTDSKSFKVENTGNDSMFLNWKLTSSGGAWTYSPPGYVGAGAAATASVDFKAAQNGTSTATLTPSQPFLLGVAACKPLVSVSLSGQKP